MEKKVLVSVKDIREEFPVSTGFAKKGVVKALDGISFDIYQGETVGLVGESGCGKSTLGRVILNLIPATSGSVSFEGHEIAGLSDSRMRPYRKDMQIIFQDPYGCLNPRQKVYDIIAAPLRLQGVKDKKELDEQVFGLMEKVGLRRDYYDRFPHEFSGGQRQRIGIARAIATHPKFIVCDEPVSALDVSVQAQVVNLIQDLQAEFQLTYLFISHDLRVVKHLCDRVLVMYLGVVVEMGTKAQIYGHPAHPYTGALLSAVPEVTEAGMPDKPVLEGEIPSPLNVPTGCRFHTRCPYATEKCAREVPPLRDLGDGHKCACFYDFNRRTGGNS